MKPESEKECRQRLLRDLFADDFDSSQQIPEHQRVLLREFRLAHWRRKTSRALVAASAVLLIAFLTSFSLRKRSQQISSSLPPDHATTNTIRSAALISDEELLGLFPPNSCFLAEFNGKQVLVFNDPTLNLETVVHHDRDAQKLEHR